MRFAGCGVGGAEEAVGAAVAMPVKGVNSAYSGLDVVWNVSASLRFVVLPEVHLWCSRSPNVSWESARVQGMVVGLVRLPQYRCVSCPILMVGSA